MGDRGWDPFKTFKLSEAERDLIDRRRKTKDKFRAEYRKLLTDPRMEYIVDHNFERWFAYKNNQVQLLVSTKSNIIKGLMYSYVPCVIFGLLMRRAVEKREERIMNGEITWRDRVRSIIGIGTTT